MPMNVWVVVLGGSVDSCWFVKESAFTRADYLLAQKNTDVAVSCHPINT